MSISSVGRAAERRGPSPRMLLRLVLKDARDAIHCSAHRGCCPPPSTSISSATGVGFLQSCIYTFRAALSKPAIQHLRNQILERGCVDADLVLPHGDGDVEEHGRGELCGEQGHYAGLRLRRMNLRIVLGGEGGIVVRVRDQRMRFSQDSMYFDTNRSSIHGAAAAAAALCRASMDHHDPVKTLEIDTARPFSYSTPRRKRRRPRR